MTGSDVDLDFHAFPDLESNLRAQVDRIKPHPWITDVPVHGLIYEVEPGAGSARSPEPVSIRGRPETAAPELQPRAGVRTCAHGR